MFDKEEAMKEVENLGMCGGVYPSAILRTAIDRIEELENKTIRCSEEMPKKKDFPILVWNGRFWWVQENDSDFEEECDEYAITHWTRLPPKPE